MTALRLTLSQTNLFSPQHLAVSRLPASRPDQGSEPPAGTYPAAEHWMSHTGAAGSAQSHPLISALNVQELPRSQARYSADSKTQCICLREVPSPLRARQQGFEKPKPLKWNTALFAGASLLYRFETGGSHFCMTLYKINSKAEQWKSYYATRIHEPRVRLDFSHKHFTNTSNTRHLKSHGSEFLKSQIGSFFDISIVFSSSFENHKDKKLSGGFYMKAES